MRNVAGVELLIGVVAFIAVILFICYFGAGIAFGGWFLTTFGTLISWVMIVVGLGGVISSAYQGTRYYVQKGLQKGLAISISQTNEGYSSIQVGSKAYDKLQTTLLESLKDIERRDDAH